MQPGSGDLGGGNNEPGRKAESEKDAAKVVTINDGVLHTYCLFWFSSSSE
jgi:hypothetical protein